MTEKAFAADSQYPELAPDKLRLYSMRFCPYAQRTRLVLDFLKIPHEVVNINLKSKPEWFLERNPYGLVPVLEQNDKIVYESAVCDEYLTDVYGSKGLIPSDPYKKARSRILMDTYSKVTDKFYGVMRSTTDDDRTKATEELHKALNVLETALTGKYFGGEEPGILDFHAWPWFERLPVLEQLTGANVFPEDKLPKLTAWVKTMHELPAVQATRFSVDQHAEFIKPILSGGTPNYDLGLEE
jgi:glutathione S-transferase